MRFSLSAGRISTNIYTSPHNTPDLDPEPALIQLLQSAKTSIYFAAYSFTLAAVADVLIQKHQSGVAVQGVGDANEWSNVTSQYPRLAVAGVDVRRWGGSYQLMHDKVAIIDGNKVALGSYNWTSQAEKVNVEVFMTLTGVQVSRVLAPVLTQQIQTAYSAGKSA